VRDGARVQLTGTYSSGIHDKLLRGPRIDIDSHAPIGPRVHPGEVKWTLIEDGPIPMEPPGGSVVVKDGIAWTSAIPKVDWETGPFNWSSPASSSNRQWADLCDGEVVWTRPPTAKGSGDK